MRGGGSARERFRVYIESVFQRTGRNNNIKYSLHARCYIYCLAPWRDDGDGVVHILYINRRNIMIYIYAYAFK